MKWKNAELIDTEKRIYRIPESWLFLHYYDALSILFRIENSLRIFVYIILKKEFKEKWSGINITSDDSAEIAISSIAKKRLTQAKTFGYSGYLINCPIMHLTSGELIRLITSDSYWKYFSNFFLGSREIIKNKLEEIGSVRNSLAHFRPIKEDDIELVKTNAKHVLMKIESFLNDIMCCRNMIPSNNPNLWYQELKILGTDQSTLTFFQNEDENWIRINIEYNCPIIRLLKFKDSHIFYRVLSIISSAILNEFTTLRNLLIYLSENIPYIEMGENFTPNFRKTIQLCFNLEVLKAEYEKVKLELKKILLTISQETELIENDNFAKGKLVELISTNARRIESNEHSYWRTDTNNFITKLTYEDPPEFFGILSQYYYDFVAQTKKYPWMPTPICRKEYDFE